MAPGFAERRTHAYRRHGITSLFAAFDIATGAVIGETHRQNRSAEFKTFLDRIDSETPADLDVHLVMDDCGTHPADPPLAAPTPPLPRSLHPDLQLLDQPGGAVVRPAHREADPERHPSQHARLGGCHPPLHRDLQMRGPSRG